MPNPSRTSDLRDTIDMLDEPCGLQRWHDRQYRAQGLQNVLESAADLQKKARGNEYLQRTNKLAEQARTELRTAMAVVFAEKQKRLAALREATRTSDDQVIEQMRELIRQKMGRWTNELPDELARILRPTVRTVPTVNRRPIGNRLRSCAPRVIDKLSAVQASVDDATRTGSPASGLAGQLREKFVTNFEAAAEDLAAPYTESLFECVLNKIEQKLLPHQRMHLKEIWHGYKATHTLLTKVPVLDAFAGALDVHVPDAAVEALKDATNPVGALLNAAVVKIADAFSLDRPLEVASGVQTTAMPFTKLIQPIMSLASLLRQQPRIDAMHALHQRLPVAGPSRDAAFQIVDRWETALVRRVGGANYVYAFINELRDIHAEIKGGQEKNPAEVLWFAAQDEGPVSRDECDSALLVLATLFGGGDATQGIDEAVAAVVSDRTSGVAWINKQI